ncbi:hypothetical protein [Bartonella tribocorum]|nr:hypothetical protein [Bartonella tribocorum]
MGKSRGAFPEKVGCLQTVADRHFRSLSGWKELITLMKSIF